MQMFPNVDATPEETAHQYNGHKWFVKNFLQEDEQLLKLSVRSRAVRALPHRCHFVFQLASLISGVWGAYN